jgi:UDP-2-acetamido-3-amino-2,3-dideoxy-glucuronate N-acetyltransferase
MNITTHRDFDEERGYLLPITFSEDLNFIPKRLFIVNSVQSNDVRGNHAHYTTKQLLICTNGNVNVTLDTGYTKKTTLLTKGQSIQIPELVWDSQEFLSITSAIAVLCSTEYNIKDYILDYTTFLQLTKAQNE